MTQKIKAYVLDTWAIIAYLEDEPSAELVSELISKAHERHCPIFMTVVNAGEVWYTVAREISENEANTALKALSELRIQLINIDWELTQESARFKSQHKLSYADCFAAALSKQLHAVLITGDKEFKALENHIQIHWV